MNRAQLMCFLESKRLINDSFLLLEVRTETSAGEKPQIFDMPEDVKHIDRAKYRPYGTQPGKKHEFKQNTDKYVPKKKSSGWWGVLDDVGSGIISGKPSRVYRGAKRAGLKAWHGVKSGKGAIIPALAAAAGGAAGHYFTKRRANEYIWKYGVPAVAGAGAVGYLAGKRDD